jgi:hypothetical protein
MSHGITRPQSVIRINTTSFQPPRNPETKPTADPMSIVMIVAVRPTRSETFAPWIVSVSTERPWSSVPSGYCGLGGANRGPVALVTSMPCLSAKIAKIATAVKNTRMMRPAMPIRSLRNSVQNRRIDARRRAHAIRRGEVTGTGVVSSTRGGGPSGAVWIGGSCI